jgi:hypothetical protein
VRLDGSRSRSVVFTDVSRVRDQDDLARQTFFLDNKLDYAQPRPGPLGGVGLLGSRTRYKKKYQPTHIHAYLYVTSISLCRPGQPGSEGIEAPTVAVLRRCESTPAPGGSPS